MSTEIEAKRRELFEAWYVTDCLHGAQITITAEQVASLRGEHSDYRERAALHGKWVGWNAGLDAVVIRLPFEACNGMMSGDRVRAAIESTGLGLKVAP